MEKIMEKIDTVIEREEKVNDNLSLLAEASRMICKSSFISSVRDYIKKGNITEEEMEWMEDEYQRLTELLPFKEQKHAIIWMGRLYQFYYEVHKDEILLGTTSKTTES